MEYTITPLTPHTGAEVRGIDLNEGVDAETGAALNRAFAEHHVLVVRGQQFTPPQFIAAAQVFGELFQHDKREMHVPGYPQIYYVSNEQTVPGKRYISGETFHTDHSNHPTPPKATMLFPVSLPSRGGDTQYVNMHAAYDDLPAATKERIDGLRGREDEEALDLVATLMAHATEKKYEYRPQWHYGDFVIWDNRSVTHKANPDYDVNERRSLSRLMLKGETPV